MHRPKPFGLHNKGYTPTERDIAFINSQMSILGNLKDVSGLQSIHRKLALPDGGTVLLQNAGGILRAITYVGKDEQEEIKLGKRLAVPMLFSGIVLNPIAGRRENVNVKITDMTRRRLAKYGDISGIPKVVSLRKFLVRSNHRFANKGSQWHTDKITQYKYVTGSIYSGLMGKAVQVVLGFGRQIPESKKLSPPDSGSGSTSGGGNGGNGDITVVLPDNGSDTVQDDYSDGKEYGVYHEHEGYNFSTMSLPTEVSEQIKAELKGKFFPYPDGIAADGRVKYEAEREVILKSSDGVCWIARIGIAKTEDDDYIMPLPLIYATTTKAFRRYVESVKDDEILDILDTFGGIPSGRSFRQINLDEYIGLGVVQRLTQFRFTADFTPNNYIVDARFTLTNRAGFNANESGNRIAYVSYYTGDREARNKSKIVSALTTATIEIPKCSLIRGLHDTGGKRNEDVAVYDAYIQAVENSADGSHEAKVQFMYRLMAKTFEEIVARGRALRFDAYDFYADYEYWRSLGNLERLCDISVSVKQTDAANRAGRFGNRIGYAPGSISNEISFGVDGFHVFASNAVRDKFVSLEDEYHGTYNGNEMFLASYFDAQDRLVRIATKKGKGTDGNPADVFVFNEEKEYTGEPETGNPQRNYGGTVYAVSNDVSSFFILRGRKAAQDAEGYFGNGRLSVRLELTENLGIQYPAGHYGDGSDGDNFKVDKELSISYFQSSSRLETHGSYLRNIFLENRAYKNCFGKPYYKLSIGYFYYDDYHKYDREGFKAIQKRGGLHEFVRDGGLKIAEGINEPIFIGVVKE